MTLMALALAWFAIGTTMAAALALTADQGLGLPLPIGFSLLLIAFGVIAGLGARATWRMSPTAPRLLQALGAAGAVASIAMALVISPPVPAAKAWTASLLGAALFYLVCAAQAKRLRRILGNAA